MPLRPDRDQVAFACWSDPRPGNSGGRANRGDREAARAGLIGDRAHPELGPVDDFQLVFSRASAGRLRLRVHPAVANVIRTAKPDWRLPRSPDQSGRSASPTGWSRFSGSAHSGSELGPSRCVRPTRARFTSVTATGSPTTPSLLARSPTRSNRSGRSPELWLELACRVGLIERDPAGERLLAAAPEFWTDNAVHLPQMIATEWLGLRNLARAGSDAVWQHCANVGVAVSSLCLAALSIGTRRIGVGRPGRPGEQTSRNGWPAWDRLSFAEEADPGQVAQRRSAPLPAGLATGLAQKARRAGSACSSRSCLVRLIRSA